MNMREISSRPSATRTDLSAIPHFTGARIRRREDPALVTGQAKYTADLQPEATSAMAFVRSPYAHARILDIDSSAAQEMPGVVAVLTGAEMKQLIPTPVPGGTPPGRSPYQDGQASPRPMIHWRKLQQALVQLLQKTVNMAHSGPAVQAPPLLFRQNRRTTSRRVPRRIHSYASRHPSLSGRHLSGRSRPSQYRAIR